MEKARGGNLNFHWTHNFDGGDSLGAAVFRRQFRPARLISLGSGEELTTYDAQIQHSTSLGWKDAFIWGGEYRQFKEILL